MKIISASLLLVALTANLVAPGQDRPPFIRADAPVIALTHVRVIDGTGAAAVEDSKPSSSVTGRSNRLAQLKLRVCRPMLKRSISTAIRFFLDWWACTTTCSFRWVARRPFTRVWANSFSRLYLALGSNDYSHRRKRGSVHRSRNQAADRQRPNDRTKDECHCALS